MSILKVFRQYSKRIAIIVSFVVVILAVRQLHQLVDAPNLLSNGNFASDDLAAWEVVNQGDAAATVVAAKGLQLKIGAGAAAGSWTGVGQQIAVEPGQQYSLSLDYFIVERNEDLVNLLLRVSQLNQAGEVVETIELSPAERFTESTEQVEHTFEYTFIANESAGTVEIGIGLFGNQATTVEVGRIGFNKHPTVLSLITWPIIALGLLILLAAAGLGIFRLFARTLSGASGAGVWRRRLAIAGINLILFFAFAEVAALGLYFLRDGTLFYTNKNHYDLIADTGQANQLTAKRIHPYLGYTDRPGWLRADDSFWESQDDAVRGINNHGFGSAVDYPYLKTNDNQYLIGIFGGSVAEQFAVLAGDKLVAALRKDTFFADKEIVALNFAKGGYKQPQQLLTLNYFLSIGQTFDLVINIDGFNEVAFAHRNYQRDVDISMPHINILEGLITLSDQNTLTPAKLESLAAINAHKMQLNRLAGRLNRMPLASISFVLEQYYAIVFNRYQQELQRFDALASDSAENSLVFVKPNERAVADELLFGNIATLWAQSSVLMHRAVQGSGATYFHVLQPNQHYSNKSFTEIEIERALDRDQPYYSTLIKLGYPALLEVIPDLIENDVNFFDGVALFDDEARTIYRDNCCHYNDLGNEILAEFIADSILKSDSFRESHHGR